MFRIIALCLCLLFYAGPILADSACAGKMVKGKSVDGKPYQVAISSAWSDEQILLALKLDVRDAKVTWSLGPDGFGVFYEYSEAKVSIGHSVSDGVTVTLSSKGTTIIWDLGLCRS